MTDNPTGRIDMSSEMHDLAQQTFDQAKKAFEGFVTAAQQTANALEKQATTTQASVKDVRDRAMSLAQKNVVTSFDFAQKLVRAHDAQEMVKLQAEFFESQMHALADQAKELGESVAKMATT